MVGAHQPARHREHQGRPRDCSASPTSTGVVLPKAESGADIAELAHRTGNIPIHAIVTETAASLFGLLSYRDPKSPLAAMSWGAEDLSAALGASTKYDANGDLSFTYKLARSLCLAGAVAAGVQPVDGVFADFSDEAGLATPKRRRAARRLHRQARHPPGAGRRSINAAFTPSATTFDCRGDRRRLRGRSQRRSAVGRRKNGRPPAPRSGEARSETIEIGG